MYRRPPVASFDTHSLTLPAMSYVPYGSESARTPDANGALAGKVAEAENFGKDAERARRVVPVIERRQLTAGISRVCRRLVPAHAAHRPVVLPVGVLAELPCRRPWTSRLVLKLVHGLRPGQWAPVLDERFTPEAWVAVSAVVDEPLEGAVGHLKSIQPVGRQIDLRVIAPRGERSGGHVHHAGNRGAFRVPSVRRRFHGRGRSRSGRILLW